MDPEFVLGENHVDPAKWSPLIYNFRHYFRRGEHKPPTSLQTMSVRGTRGSASTSRDRCKRALSPQDDRPCAMGASATFQGENDSLCKR